MADMKFDYAQKLQQQLRLSPQMIQSIELLKLPIEDLCDRIYKEAEQNPAIEIKKDADLSVRSINSKQSSISHSSNASDSFQAFLENTANHEESLQEHLLFQLSLMPISPKERNLGEKIIQNLDYHGFHSEEPETLLSEGESLPLLKKMLKIVRNFDPQGCACANVQESLLFQASLLEDFPLLAHELLKNYFTVLEKKRPGLIKKHLSDVGVDCSTEDIENALLCIKTLEPFPARQFENLEAKVQYVVPEILVYKTECNLEDDKESFTIEFLRGSIPEIHLSPVFLESLESKRQSKEEHRFTSDSIQRAEQFMQSLSYRANAIHRVVHEIVLKQADFFYKGPGHLVPLRQKDISESLNIHEATISRITNGKYLQCEWGVFELKHFFTNAVNAINYTEVEQVNTSKDAIKHQLLLLLQENEKSGSKNLSDSKLAKILEDKGIQIARRTVAKYRKELNFESSFDRL